MSEAKPKIVIKKYENRRLYDSAQSRYVNLEDIAAIIRDGHDVQVVDAKNGDDVTRSILTQIIVDESKGKESGLPLDLLKQIIVSSQQARHQFLEWYFKSAIETFERIQNPMRGFQAPAGMPQANPLDAMMNLFRGVPGSVPFMPFMGFQPPAPEPAKAASESASRSETEAPASADATPNEARTQGAASVSEVSELTRRLEELERQLSSKHRKATRKPKRSSS